MREKLIELVVDACEEAANICAGADCNECVGKNNNCLNFLIGNTIADYLIANGVTVRAKGEWLVGMIKPWNMEVGNWKCSVCKGVSLQAKNFCPNCGADMRGVEHGSD